MKTKTISVGLPGQLANLAPAELRELLVAKVIAQREYDFIEVHPQREIKVIRIEREYADEISQQAAAHNMSVLDYTAALLGEGV